MRSKILDTLLSHVDKDIYEQYGKKTIVITGATGLLGSLVCKALLLANDRLDLDCRLVALARDEAKLSLVLDGYSELGDIRFVECDLLNEVPHIETADYILHAAAVTQSKCMVKRPVDVALTSLRGTESMLELARNTSARMVYVSSMEIYGTLAEGEVASEETLGWIDLVAPRSCYPESKRMCECLCAAYASQYGVQVCNARLAQTFGAGVLPGDNRAFAQFARSAIRGKDVVLKTQGLSEGNYVNTVDCIAAVLMLLACGESATSYNIANEATHGTIREVAELACNVLGDGRSRVCIDCDEHNSAGYAPDVHLRMSSARLRALGWEPTMGLSDSFVELAQYMREQGMV